MKQSLVLDLKEDSTHIQSLGVQPTKDKGVTKSESPKSFSRLCQHVPIDVVYTWVNGSDPWFQVNKSSPLGSA